MHLFAETKTGTSILIDLTTAFIYCPWNRAGSWSCSYGNLIYNWLCNQCLSPLTLWMSLRRCVLDTTSC